MPIPFKPLDRLKLERKPTGINAEERLSNPEKALTLGSAALDPMGTIAQMGLERLLGGKEESIFDNLVDNPRTGKQEIAERQEAFIPHVWKNSTGPKAEKARQLYRSKFGWAPATKDKPADAIIIRRAQEEPGNRMMTSSGRGSVFAEKADVVHRGGMIPQDSRNPALVRRIESLAEPEGAGYFKANKDTDGSQVGGSNVIVSAITPKNPLFSERITQGIWPDKSKIGDTGHDALASLAGDKAAKTGIRRYYYDKEKKAMPLATRGGYDAIIGRNELMLKEPSPKDPGIRDAVKEQQKAKVKEKAFMRVPHEYDEIGEGLMPKRLWKRRSDGMMSWQDARRPDPDIFSNADDNQLLFDRGDVINKLKGDARKTLNVPPVWLDAEESKAKAKKISGWAKNVFSKNLIPTDNLKLGLRATEPDKWLEKALPKVKHDYGPEGVPAKDLQDPETRKAFIDKWLSGK